MIWYSGQTALFLFLLAKAVPAFLPIAYSVALWPLFPFQQAQYVQVFPLKPAPFCTLFAGLGNTNKFAISRKGSGNQQQQQQLEVLGEKAAKTDGPLQAKTNTESLK